MCETTHEHCRPCLCQRICGIIKLITIGVVLGGIAGMVAMYFFDHDRWLQCRTKKMIKDAENFTKGVGEKITGAMSGSN